MRNLSFAVGEFYHVYNRGVDKRSIFQDEDDLNRFFQSMSDFNTLDPIGSIYERSFVKEDQLGSSASKLVNFVAYCLNFNHYHFLVEQVAEEGVQKFMHRLATGYTKYFNEKQDRSGALFQGRFKAIHVETNEYLLQVSAYVNLNDRVHQRGIEYLAATEIPSRSSWDEYGAVGVPGSGFCEKKIIVEQFGRPQEYLAFAEETVGDIIRRRKENKALELLLLE